MNYAEENKRLIILIVATLVVMFSILFAYYCVVHNITIRGDRLPPYCQYGDIDGNGWVDSYEYLYTPTTWASMERADVDNDGDYDGVDATLITHYINGWIDTFPVANSSSPSYQYDGEPYVDTTWYTPTTVYIGEDFYYYFTVNDSNGETLKAKVQITKGGQTIYTSPVMKVEAGQENYIVYRFTEPGTYTIVTYVTYYYRQAQWWSNELMPTTINVIEGNRPPIPDFIYTEPVAGREITFDASASYDPDGYIVEYMWNIAGTIKYGVIVNHIFLYAGSYPVSLRVTDNGGKSSFENVTITVVQQEYTPPIADFTFNIDGKIVYFIDKSIDDGFIVMWNWDFGDGEISQAQNPIHVYDAFGTYQVTLTVRDNDGLKDSITKEIQLQPYGYPIANFTFLVEGKTIHFYDGSTDDGYIVNWTWNFGDGSTSYEQNPQHTYDEAGEYMVVLTVMDNDGLTATVMKTVKIEGGNTIYYFAGIGLLAGICGVVLWKRRKKR